MGGDALATRVDPPSGGDKAGNRADWPVRRRFQLNEPVADQSQITVSTYRLAPALGLRMVGRSLVTLAVLVLLATLLDAVTGVGWWLTGGLAILGLLLVALWAAYLFRRAWAVRLTGDGYAVRFLAGVGASAASWSEVDEVVAASPAGQPCLELRLRDRRATRLPMAALAGDPDTFARDVRRRVRDAHTPAGPDPASGPEAPES
jgi:hypothetical protein